MAQNDEFEIIAKNVEADFHFHIDFGEYIQVWAVGQVVDIGVYKNNELMECGHNRIEE